MVDITEHDVLRIISGSRSDHFRSISRRHLCSAHQRAGRSASVPMMRYALTKHNRSSSVRFAATRPSIFDVRPIYHQLPERIRASCVPVHLGLIRRMAYAPQAGPDALRRRRSENSRGSPTLDRGSCQDLPKDSFGARPPRQHRGRPCPSIASRRFSPTSPPSRRTASSLSVLPSLLLFEMITRPTVLQQKSLFLSASLASHGPSL